LLNMNLRTGPPPTGTTWSDQSDWGLVLADWLRQGIETYYLAGFKYTWKHHTFILDTSLLDVGGHIDVAPTGGPLAGTMDFGGEQIDWLRLADFPEPVGVNGSCYRISSTWLGGPAGHWDAVLYAP
jgi:hypothetical protein